MIGIFRSVKRRADLACLTEPALVAEFAVARGLIADRRPAGQRLAVASVVDQATDFPGGRLQLPGYSTGDRQELHRGQTGPLNLYNPSITPV